MIRSREGKAITNSNKNVVWSESVLLCMSYRYNVELLPSLSGGRSYILYLSVDVALPRIRLAVGIEATSVP